MALEWLISNPESETAVEQMLLDDSEDVSLSSD